MTVTVTRSLRNSSELAPKEPDSTNAQYSIPVPTQQGKTITEASLSWAPSGSGELLLDTLAISGGGVTFKAGGGVASRVYTLKLAATLSDGSVVEVVRYLTIVRTLAVYPTPEPLSTAFSTPITTP